MMKTISRIQPTVPPKRIQRIAKINSTLLLCLTALQIRQIAQDQSKIQKQRTIFNHFGFFSIQLMYLSILITPPIDSVQAKLYTADFSFQQGIKNSIPQKCFFIFGLYKLTFSCSFQALVIRRRIICFFLWTSVFFVIVFFLFFRVFQEDFSPPPIDFLCRF